VIQLKVIIMVFCGQFFELRFLRVSQNIWCCYSPAW